MLQYFNELFRYNNWANGEMLKALQHAPQIPEGCVPLLSHLVSAQQVWLERINLQLECKIHMTSEYTLNECAKYSLENTHQWLELVRSSERDKLDAIVEYYNVRGKCHSIKMWQIMAHVLNHSSYHRGQINRLLRENHLPTAPCDYIFYSRVKH